jgi:molybdenum cofactor guanylyltransferase
MPMPVTAGNDAVLRVAGLILAGGEGRRMGGVDKGWQQLAGRALVEHVLARLAPQVECVFVSANRSLDAYRALGCPVLADDVRWRGMGPLAGLASVAEHLPAGIDAIQLAPCDTPLLPADLVARLLPALEDDAACGGCFPQTPDGPEPGMLLVRVPALASLPDYLQEGGRSLRGWIGRIGGRAVPFDMSPAFANANDPASLVRLESLVTESPKKPGCLP